MRLSELRMGSEVRADTDEADPDAPAGLARLIEVDSAADAFVFGENQVAVDQVIPLEAALDVPAAVVGRDPLQVPDGGEAGGEHAEVAIFPTV